MLLSCKALLAAALASFEQQLTECCLCWQELLEPSKQQQVLRGTEPEQTDVAARPEAAQTAHLDDVSDVEEL